MNMNQPPPMSATHLLILAAMAACGHFSLRAFRDFVVNRLSVLASLCQLSLCPIPAIFGQRMAISQNKPDISGHFRTLKWVKFHKLSAILRQYRHFFTMCLYPPPPPPGHSRTFSDMCRFYTVAATTKERDYAAGFTSR